MEDIRSSYKENNYGMVLRALVSVSYTHLTLPTSDLV